MCYKDNSEDKASFTDIGSGVKQDQALRGGQEACLSLKLILKLGSLVCSLFLNV
jgi:hypothetical protein